MLVHVGYILYYILVIMLKFSVYNVDINLNVMNHVTFKFRYSPEIQNIFMMRPKFSLHAWFLLRRHHVVPGRLVIGLATDHISYIPVLLDFNNINKRRSSLFG